MNQWVIQRKALNILFQIISAHNREQQVETKGNKCKINQGNMLKSYRPRENKGVFVAPFLLVYIIKL
jgi:hypothetical protein